MVKNKRLEYLIMLLFLYLIVGIGLYVATYQLAPNNKKRFLKHPYTMFVIICGWLWIVLKYIFQNIKNSN